MVMRSTCKVALSLCGLTLTTPAVAETTKPTAPTTAEKSSADQLAAGTVARFSTGQITTEELQKRLASMPAAMRARYANSEQLRQLYEETLRYKLLVAEAKRRGYDQRASVRDATRQNAVQALIRSAVDDAITPDKLGRDEVEAYYKAHLKEYQRPELRRISHIQVESRARAQQLLKELANADLKTFRAMAQRTSDDQRTRLRGGDLRFFDADGQPPAGSESAIADPALVKAAFTLKHLGDLYPQPVAHGTHFSVVKLTGKRAAEHRTVEDAEDAIRSRLVHEQRQRALDALIERLKQQQQPKVDAERITWVQLEQADPHVPRGPGIPAEFPTGKDTASPPTE